LPIIPPGERKGGRTVTGEARIERKGVRIVTREARIGKRKAGSRRS
jgi:hypothetical protein